MVQCHVVRFAFLLLFRIVEIHLYPIDGASGKFVVVGLTSKTRMICVLGRLMCDIKYKIVCNVEQIFERPYLVPQDSVFNDRDLVGKPFVSSFQRVHDRQQRGLRGRDVVI